jgi:hypothetical protein
MAFLYTNPRGYQVTAHSYSAGLDFSCPKKYFFRRIEGWQSREEGVALFFGRAVEDAIKYHHTQNFEPESGVLEFKKLWFHYQNDTSLSYTERSGDWADHYRMGSELLALYEAQRPELPILNEKFQVSFRKELFPNTEYAGLEFLAIADIVSEVPWNHPLLPPMEHNGSDTRKVVIDLKTSSARYFSDPRLAALDGQLRTYAWASGISDVAFLVLVKNHSTLGVGDWVTVLKGPDILKKYQVLDVNDERVIVLPKTFYDEFMERRKEIKGKGKEERIESLLAEYFYKGKRFAREDLTKQSIQFLSAIINPEDCEEVGYEFGKEAIGIANCNEKGYWPKNPGVRFPHSQCLSCDMIGLCINDPEMVKEKLVKIDDCY